MRKIVLAQALFYIFMFCVSVPVAFADLSYSKGADWGYNGNVGPEFWGDLRHDYVTCKAGKQQSPIDLQPDPDVFTGSAPRIFRYGPNVLSTPMAFNAAILPNTRPRQALKGRTISESGY